MNIPTLLILAFGLSMDAFAVSICNCLCYQKYGKKEVVLSAFFYGLFQGLMPVIGFLLGTQFLGVISSIDHWVALVLLGIIGGKMIKDACLGGSHDGMEEKLDTKTLIIQSIATSIDALAVGISMAALKVDILTSAGIIAISTFLCCVVGGAIGKRFGELLGKKAQLIGGVILIAIGVKIFIEHVFLV